MTRSENKLEGDLNIDVQNQYKDIAHMEKKDEKNTDFILPIPCRKSLTQIRISKKFFLI